jgi:anti-sigma regulatory factor (Ser/Thr protein kinase)
VTTMRSTQRFVVRDSSQVAEARRSVVSLAQEMGFGETESAQIALVVTEAATNLLKHGGGGELLATEICSAGTRSLDILALDKGSGMADVARCFEDGYSLVGSPGTGLGAMRRLSSVCCVYSRLVKGCAVLCRFQSKNGRAPSSAFDNPWIAVSGVSVAMKGESECGDGWAFEQAGGMATLLVADGLGHGPLAADASLKAIETFHKYASLAPVHLLGRIHSELRSTRGAAAGVARLDRFQRTVTFAGIGNIAGTVAFPGGSRQMVCLAGIVGHEARSVREFVYDWPAGALVALASDGLVTQWSLRTYEELFREDPALIAGVLYRDFNRGRDDATVVVAAESGALP